MCDTCNKDETPCDSYIGNMCSGFGGKTICWVCGWDMYEHPEWQLDWSSLGDNARVDEEASV
jgi:hypothetical protein